MTLQRPFTCLPGLVTLLTGLCLCAAPAPASEFPMADNVVVEKENRKLHLMRKGEIFRTFDVALGVAPIGNKEREGDQRTPEGRYLLDIRNPDSDFFLSIHISRSVREIRERRKAAICWISEIRTAISFYRSISPIPVRQSAQPPGRRVSTRAVRS